MLTFAAAVFLLMVTPGPGVLTAAGVGSGFGFQAGLEFIKGLFIGTNLVALGVVTGLAAIVFAVPWLRTVLLVASAGYLIYLAVRIAMSGSQIAFMVSRRKPGVLSGLLLQVINPKAYAVNTALFTGFAFWPDSLLVEIILKFVIMNVIWIPIHLAWLGAGVSVHRLDLGAWTQTFINVSMAAAMLLVVGLAVWAQIRA